MTPRLARRAFTLIELLIVVAIISVLASIAVPNFLEAQTRAKVAAAHSDLRVMALAIEMYQVDNNTYPSRTKEPLAPDLQGCADITLRSEELSRLTSPVAYISSLPYDLLVPKGGSLDLRDGVEAEQADIRLYDFWPAAITAKMQTPIYDGPPGPPRSSWALVSVGPDATLGLPANWGNMAPPLQDNPHFVSYRHDYDPSNGTISPGNVYRLQVPGNAMTVFTYPID